MSRKWLVVALVVASSSTAQADAKRASPRSKAMLLPPEFYVVTRQCKQLFVELGTSLEATQPDLVNATSAADYISVCRRTNGTGAARCVTQFKDKTQNFASSGDKAQETTFLFVLETPSLTMLQDMTGGMALYINTQTRDVVTVSRQYFELAPNPAAATLAANAKVCKALLLDEEDVSKLSKEK